MRIGLLLVALAMTNAAAETRFHSGPQRVPLLELFTSEGCSSCPPADRWLSAQIAHPALWQQLIPIAWHVDYWDQLGWPDRFAKPEHSRRQHRYAGVGRLSQVYTPGMIYDGNEWRGFFRQQSLPPLSPATVGDLQVRVADHTCHIRYSGVASSDWQAHMVLLGFGLQSAVQRGENRGRTLQHDFVVLAHAVAPAITAAAEPAAWQAALPRSPIAANRYALVVWLARQSDPTPIQSTGGWLPTAAEQFGSR